MLSFNDPKLIYEPSFKTKKNNVGIFHIKYLLNLTKNLRVVLKQFQSFYFDFANEKKLVSFDVFDDCVVPKKTICKVRDDLLLLNQTLDCFSLIVNARD